MSLVPGRELSTYTVGNQDCPYTEKTETDSTSPVSLCNSRNNTTEQEEYRKPPEENRDYVLHCDSPL